MHSQTSTLLFVRHAETDLAGTFCGHTDPPLNERGRIQLVGLIDRVAGHPISAIYTSDLLRARETAEALAMARGLGWQGCPALREIHFGEWEGLDWETIEARDKAYASRWVSEFPAIPAPGGEAIPSFRQRVLGEITRLRAEAADRSIAVVTHTGVLRVLLEELGHFAPHHAWERTREYTCVIPCTQKTPEGPLTVDR